MNKEKLKQSKIIGEFAHPEMLDRKKIEREGLEATDNMLAKMAVYLNRPESTRYFESYDWIIPVIQKIIREHVILYVDDMSDKEWAKKFCAIAAMSLSNPVEIMANKTAEYITWYNNFIKNKIL